MKNLHQLCACVLLATLFALPGCSNNDNSTVKKSESPAKDAGNSNTIPATDAESLVMGKWTVDRELTKKAWGTRSAEMEKKLFDQLGMTIVFKPQNQYSIINNDGNGETYNVYWEVTDKSDSALKILIAENKDSSKRIQVNISFQNKDRIKYQSSEGEFKDDLIFCRAAN